MQHDMYHVYTVDEHTIFAIGILRGIEQGKYKEDMPFATEAMQRVVSRRALLLRCYFMISRKDGRRSFNFGCRGGKTHVSQAGFVLGRDGNSGVVSSLCLLMSHIAFHRDLIDPKTIADFVERVQSLERLRLPLCLTVADIRAVGPNVWNN